MVIKGRGNGRGRGRGRGRSHPPDHSQSRIDMPPPRAVSSSRGPTSTPTPLTAGGPSTAPVPPSTAPVPPPSAPTSAPSSVGSPIETTSVPPPTAPPTGASPSVPSSEGSHVETNRRMVIFVDAIAKPRRFLPQSVTCEIMANVMTRMPVPAEKWRNYPIQMRDELFNDFIEKYQFASDYDLSMARTVWERTCMDRYPDDLKKYRQAIMKKLNTSNIADLKGNGPPSMKTEVWDGLVDIWLTPEWQRKSDAGRSNRAALPDAILHTGGSVSFGCHKKRMEAYDTAMMEKYGDDSSMHPSIDPEVWMGVSGPSKKGRVYGIGQGLDVGFGESTPISCSTVVGPSSNVPPTQDAIRVAVNEAMTSFVQTLLVPMLQPILSSMVGSQATSVPSQAPPQAHREDHEVDD